MKSDRISDALLPAGEPTGARLGRALLWQPSFVRDDKILWHVPFLFWLLEATQPRQYVEIGVGQGVGYMAVCQALHRMRANSRCYAVGEWKEEGEQNNAPQSFAARNAELYGDFSEILGKGYDQAADSIEDGTVDLMLVDLTVAPDAAASLHRRWIPKLSDDGILLINGIERSDEATTVLVSALSANSPTVRLPGGDGLLVVLPSGRSYDEVSRIAALAPRDPAHKLLIDMFTRLGAGTYFEVNVRDKDQRVEALDGKTKELWKARDALATEIGELREKYESRHRKVAILQSSEFDLQQAVATARVELDHARSELATLQADREKAQVLLENERAVRSETELKLREAAADAEQRKVRIDELQKRSDDQAKRHEQLTQDVATARANEAQLHEQVKAEQSGRAEAEQAHRAAAASANQEKVARATAEAQRDEACAALEESQAQAAAEREMLRSRLADLMLEAHETDRVVRYLVEIAEQNENIVAALSEELRLVRLRVRACLVRDNEPPHGTEPDGQSS